MELDVKIEPDLQNRIPDIKCVTLVQTVAGIKKKKAKPCHIAHLNHYNETEIIR